MKTYKDDYFMRLAIKKARQGVKAGQTPFGACIVKKGKVIALAHNIVWKTTDITAHAEMTAIRQACRVLKTIDLSGCIIYSTCEPCPMCFSACHWSRISKVVYGAAIADAKHFGFHELTVSCQKMKQSGRSPVRLEKNFLYEENLELFRFWSRQKGKRSY